MREEGGEEGWGGVVRGEMEGEAGDGGAEEAEPPLGDEGDGGGRSGREAEEDFFEELVAEDCVHLYVSIFKAPLLSGEMVLCPLVFFYQITQHTHTHTS